MRTKQTRIYLGVVGLALALGGAGCVGAPDEGSPAEEPAVEMTAKLVHTIDKGNGHTLEFYDFGEGQVGVKEQYEIGDQQVLDTVPSEKYTLADLYRRVVTDRPIPAEILGADARAADILSKPQVIHAALPKVAAPKRAELDPDIGVVKSAQTAGCSADLFGDLWGAQWFRTNFCSDLGYDCNGNGFPQVRHAQNTASSHSKAGGSYSWLYKQMEGDFNRAGHTSIYRNGFGLPTNVVIWGGSVPPRNVLHFTISGGWSNQTNHAVGTSPCAHEHHVMVWCGYP